jgi:hypothetical protein
MPEIADPAATSIIKLGGNTFSNALQQTAKAITETLNACCTWQLRVALLFRLQLCEESLEAAEPGRDQPAAKLFNVPLAIGCKLDELPKV